jgi:hypothetical protein
VFWCCESGDNFVLMRGVGAEDVEVRLWMRVLFQVVSKVYCFGTCVALCFGSDSEYG